MDKFTLTKKMELIVSLFFVFLILCYSCKRKETTIDKQQLTIQDSIFNDIYNVSEKEFFKIWKVCKPKLNINGCRFLILNNTSKKFKMKIDAIKPMFDSPMVKQDIFQIDNSCIDPNTETPIKYSDSLYNNEFYILGRLISLKKRAHGQQDTIVNYKFKIPLSIR